MHCIMFEDDEDEDGDDEDFLWSVWSSYNDEEQVVADQGTICLSQVPKVKGFNGHERIISGA